MPHKILFVNACVRENSRTKVLAQHFLGMLSGELVEVNLNEEHIPALTKASLAERERLLKKKAYDDPMLRYAKEFALADTIVIAAPYWDLSFPAILKVYLEAVSVRGVTYRYNRGVPSGLCRAKCLVYITTAGGMVDFDFGYNYIKTLAYSFFGIRETVCFRAEEMDLDDSSEEVIMNACKAKMARYLLKAYDLRINLMPK